MPMAMALARQMTAVLPAEYEELLSAAYLALVEAAQTFDPVRNVNFSTYARHRVRGALQDYRRFLVAADWRGDKSRAPVFRPLKSTAELHGWVIGKQVPPPVGEEIEAIEAVEFWLRRLPPLQARVCRLIYIDGLSQDEVATVVGCSKSNISRLHNQAIAEIVRVFQAAHARRESGSGPASE